MRNDYGGWMGMRFVVGANPLQVSALGRIYVDGNTQSHQLRLIYAVKGATVASVLWVPAGGAHNQIKYAMLPAPVILAANTEYYLVSQETAGGDMSYGDNTRIATTAAAGVLAPLTAMMAARCGVTAPLEAMAAGRWTSGIANPLLQASSGSGMTMKMPSELRKSRFPLES
jgi:hypothetical protein